jgi:pimeloyl-ACP methyl ester carboxylesterase
LALCGVEVWNLELSGHGRSGTTTGRVGFENYVEDAVSVIEHFSGEVVVIGHSLGGSVAYAAAGRADVRGVVGLAAIYNFGAGNTFVRGVCRITAAFSPLIWGSLRIKTRGAGSLLGRLYGLSDIMGYTLPVSGWWPGSMEREILSERLELGFDWTNLNVWLEMSRWSVSGEAEFHRPWADSGTPLLAIAGDRDTLAPMAAVRGAFDQCTSDNRVLREFDLYEDGLHWGHLDLVLGREAQDVVWPEILRWLEGVYKKTA